MSPELLPGLVAPASAVIAGAAVLTALRMRGRARADRIALRLALEREAAFVAAARRLADAARGPVAGVREEMEQAVRAIAPGIDVVLFFEEHEGALTCVAAYGARVEFFAGMRMALDDDEALVVVALRSGHRVTVEDRPLARLLHPGDAFAAAIPLVLDAGRRCVMYVAGPDGAAKVSADRIVQLVDQATPAYRIALDRADDRARAEYDGLTGLLTPRAFRARLAAAIDRARSSPLGRVGVVFVDTDHFKAWNDTYGHASGDALLRELARLLRASAAMEDDFAGRNGGDEFCLVFAGCEKSAAVERAERLRASIAGADMRALRPSESTGAAVAISASIGVACFPVDAQTPSDLLEKADAAMYHSKRTGRNGVAYFSTATTIVRAQSGSALSEKLQ